MNLKLLMCAAVLLLPSQIFAQQHNADTAFLTAAKYHAVQLHERAMRTQSRLYNGSRYIDPPFSEDHHPFFVSEDWITGSVDYDGEIFREVPLMYDLLNQVLVSEHFPSGHAIQLVTEKIHRFNLGDRQFERIRNETVNNSLPATAFYEVLYDGPTRLIARRQKFKREKIDGRQVMIEYEERNRYFVLINGIYFPVKSKGSILKLMDDRKHQLNRLLRSNGIRFGDDRERGLKSITKYYDNF